VPPGGETPLAEALAAPATQAGGTAAANPPRQSGNGSARSAGSRRQGRGKSDGAPRPPKPEPVGAEAPADGEQVVAGKASCTLAQMRRFIKSRPYVPVHELRRRFEIEGMEDEVNPMTTAQGTYYVGLPEREAGYLGELVKAGEVGCELLLDPTSPAVVGVFPMRPVARQ
jgi:hypothetical protein